MSDVEFSAENKKKLNVSMTAVTNGSTRTFNKKGRLQRKRIGCRIGRHRWINTACNIRLQRNNAHNVTAEIVDELIWMTSFFDDFSCEESKRAMSTRKAKKLSQTQFADGWYALFA